MLRLRLARKDGHAALVMPGAVLTYISTAYWHKGGRATIASFLNYNLTAL